MPLAARFKLSKYTENKGTSIRKSYSKLINLFQIQLNINCWWNIRIFFLNGIFIYSIQNTDYSDRDVNHRLLLLNYLIDCICYRLGSRFRVNEPSQIQNDAEIYNKAYLSMIEYQKHGWYSSFGYKRLCYNRVTAGTFILNLLLYWLKNTRIKTLHKGFSFS